VRFLERQMGVPIASISVGPGRDQMFDGESAAAASWLKV
jgi:adenylosuccinate synthase